MKESRKEAEIKLQLTESVYNYLKSICESAYTKVFQKNYFFDSSDHILLHNKWYLRIRIENSQKGYITVKGPDEIYDALYIRPEFESFIQIDQAESLLEGFNFHSIHLPPCTELIKRFGNHHVLPFLSFDNLRISFSWKEWKFELDKTIIKENLFYELEVETDPDHRDVLEKELQNLFQHHHWDYLPSPMSKFRRALNFR